jgi:1,2-diacylglycerol 3-beta-glucosyltransferase
MGWRKKLDLFFFLMIQYLLPSAAIPDLLMVIIRHRPPLLMPLTGVVFSISSWGMLWGLRRAQNLEKISFSHWLNLIGQTLRGMIYMLHWAIIIPSITARIALRPKRLKWVKTVHEGASEESFVS